MIASTKFDLHVMMRTKTLKQEEPVLKKQINPGKHAEWENQNI